MWSSLSVFHLQIDKTKEAKVKIQLLKKTLRVTVVMVLFCSVCCSGEIQSPNRLINNSELESQVDQLIQPLVKEDLLSGSVLIAKGGKIVLSKGYGYANRGKKTLNSPNTVFRIASTSKAITGIAILQLQEKKKLSLQDPLNKYVKGIKNGDKITIFHLLTHTSGIPNYDWSKAQGKPQELEILINWIKELPLSSEPGEKFQYSNSGFGLLAAVIEQASGLTFEEYVKENIFKPCGMADSGLYIMTKPPENMALGYSKQPYGDYKNPERPCPIGKGDGDLYSTVLDLYKLARAVKKQKLLSSSSWNQALKPFKNEYGLGWFIGMVEGEKVVYHPGGVLGYIGNFRIFPDADVIVINLFNSDFLLNNTVDEKLAKIALGKSWKPLFANSASLVAAFDKYIGEYRMDEEDTTFKLTRENNLLYFQETGHPKCKAYLLSENTIYIKENNTRIRFKIKDDGTVWYSGFFGLYLVTGERIPAKQ